MTDFRFIDPVRGREIDSRRLKSIEALREREREEFAAWYQEQCDRFYFASGPCCAGCDHWDSSAGNFGLCTKAAPVSGVEIVKSLGWQSSTYTPAPGHPYTNHDFYCGEFKDEFDWTSLDQDYLNKIGYDGT